MDIPKSSHSAELVYKDTKIRPLYITFLEPTVKRYAKAPLYLLITGGGWEEQDRATILRTSDISVQQLRANGLAVASIDYRVCDEGVNISDITVDCFDAARYLAHYADVLGIDSERFVISGHSAGAHMAMMLSYAPQAEFYDGYGFTDTFRPVAVVPLSAPTVLWDESYFHSPGGWERIFKENNTPAERKRLSPASYLRKGLPATLLCCGSSDRIVFPHASEEVHEKLMALNVDSHLVLSLGGGHSFEQMHKGITPYPDASAIQQMITDFVLSILR